MDAKAWKLFLAVFLGAMVGYFVGAGLEQNPYFAWVGAIAGGLAGYLSYDYRRVAAAVPKAWRAAVEWRADFTKVKEAWYVFCDEALPLIGGVLVLAFTIALSLLALSTAPSGKEVGGSIGASLVLSLLAVLLYGIEKDLSSGQEIECRETGILFMKRLNPVSFYLWWGPKWALQGIWRILLCVWWLVPRIPKVLAAVVRGVLARVFAIGRFMKFLFVEIHSDVRLIVGMDAALFASVNYFTGNFGVALIVAAAGGAFGLLNRYLIAKRVLGLAPRNG